MSAGDSHRYNPSNLDALNALLNAAGAALKTARTDKPGVAKGERLPAKPLSPILEVEKAGILFTGNPHEAVPRRLLLDNRLTPLERNAWQVFRLLLNDDGLTSFPTYEQLRPYLASSPFKVASRETVAKALTALRMTRWLSLGGCVRDEVTGQMKGNVYLLHDEPVSIAEACSQLVSSLILLATEQVLAQAERYPFTLLPIRMTRQSTGAGTVFLRWSRMDRSKMGVDLWGELILDDRTPTSLVSQLFAMELQRITINMQISVVHSMSRQAFLCASKVDVAEQIFQQRISRQSGRSTAEV